MTPEQWDRAKTIIELAVRQKPSERAAFVASVCADDPPLLSQIQSLLAGHDQPANPPDPPSRLVILEPPKLDKADEGPTQDDPGHSERSSTVDTRPAGIGAWGSLILLNEVGRGGFGTVYRAWDPALAREVALKIIPVPEPEKDVARAVLAEGRLLARVRHPNVVTVFGAQQIGDQVGLWMEFVRGRTLQALIERDGPMAADEASVIGMAVCSALIAVHAAGLVHRDVKTRNVMREAGGRIVLMDFGTGREIRHLVGMPAYELAGTPQYMAPEVLGGTPASPSSDLYSLGILLYQLVTGKYPLKGGSFAEVYWAHQRGERRALTEWRADLPDAFVNLIERALAPDPADRYRTAAQLKQDLAGLVGRGATPPVVVSAPQTALGVLDAAPTTPTAGTGAPVTAAEVVRPQARAWRVGGSGVLIPFTLGLLGFINSTAFNLALGRSGSFGSESAAAWVIWGVRSLVAPAVYMAMAVLPVLVVLSLVRAFARFLPPVRQRLNRLGAAVGTLAARANLNDPVVLAQTLVVVSSIALAAIYWRFTDLILASTNYISDVTSESLRPLRPANIDEQILYGRVLDLFILVFGLSLAYVLKVRSSRELRAGVGAIICSLGILAMAVLMWELPYRILWHNEFERADLGQVRCYIIGERPTEVLLHCPDETPPRNRIVRGNEASLKRLGLIESIFTPREGSQSHP